MGKKRIIIIAALAVIIITAAGLIYGLFINKNKAEEIYEKDGEKYMDYSYMSKNGGFYGTMNINDKEEISRKLILEKLLCIQFVGKSICDMDEDGVAYRSLIGALPTELIDYYFTDEVKSIFFTVQNIAGSLEISDQTDEERMISFGKNGLHVPAPNILYENAEKILSLRLYIRTVETSWVNTESEELVKSVSDLILRADVNKLDGSTERYYIKFVPYNENSYRFVYAYELEME